MCSSVNQQGGTLCQRCSATRGAESHPGQKVEAAKEALVSQMAPRLESVCAHVTTGPNGILTPVGTASFLPPASGARGHERHHSCHPLPRARRGRDGTGQHSGFVVASPSCHLPGSSWDRSVEPQALSCSAYPCSSWSPPSSSPGCPIPLIPHSLRRTLGLGSAALWSLGSFCGSQLSAWR